MDDPDDRHEAPAPHAPRLARVWVVGSVGCGKSTLAARLGALLESPVVHIDDHIWLPGWRLRERGEMLDRVEARLAGERWVMEGNLGRDATRLWAQVDRADLVVWIDLPLRVTLRRLVRRCLRRALLRERVCNGNVETLRKSFLSGNSILLYAWRTRNLRRVIYRHLLRHRPHVRLRSAREVDGWLEAFSLPLRARAAPGTGGGGAIAHSRVLC